jgi:hypothetical protein
MKKQESPLFDLLDRAAATAAMPVYLERVGKMAHTLGWSLEKLQDEVYAYWESANERRR